LIWKLLKLAKLEKVDPPSLLTRFPDSVAIPVGFIPGVVPMFQPNCPWVLATVNQYFVPAINVKGAVGVKL